MTSELKQRLANSIANSLGWDDDDEYDRLVAIILDGIETVIKTEKGE
jgi:hypothetical protein